MKILGGEFNSQGLGLTWRTFRCKIAIARVQAVDEGKSGRLSNAAIDATADVKLQDYYEEVGVALQ